MRRIVLPAAVVVAAAGMAFAAEVDSGLKPGDAAGAFLVLDCTGPAKGETLCYR